jgi:DNA-binding PadR family transcriptional regulator
MLEMDRWYFKGMLRVIVLKSLAEKPLHGYGLIARIESEYGFKPSPGAVYPLLRKLIEEGLVAVEAKREGDKVVKVYSLTEKGAEYLKGCRQTELMLEDLSRKMKIARETGLLTLAKNLLWLFRNIEKLPPERVEEFKKKFMELNGMFSEVRGLQTWT